jgi:Holliday junction DNA helicase RuvA
MVGRAEATGRAGAGMIGKLTGTLEDVSGDTAIVNVAGVGYTVFASSRTLGRLAQATGAVSLFIETHVREDHIHLYGFIERVERDWFRLLTTVQGVGAKVALSILSTLSGDELAQAIMAQDKAMVSRADGVGPKLANRIVSELKDKVASGSFGSAVLREAGDAAPAAENAAFADAVSALVNLGYRRSEAYSAIARAAGSLGSDPKTDQLIRAGLKELSAA